MKKQCAIAILSISLWTASGTSLAVDTRSAGNDLYLRVASLETTVAVLHRDISSLHEVLIKQQVAPRDLPPQAVPVTSGCRPPVNRCAQRRSAQK